MDMEKYIQETEQWKCRMEAELRQCRSELQRQDDYRQIMNAMAAHSFGYNSQNQKNELDKYWVKSREDIYYNGHTTQKGVYEYYVDGTKEIRDSQREIINRVYGADIPENVNVGYRVMNMLTTPFIQIAGDRKTAKGSWMNLNILCRVNQFGVPEPQVSTCKMTAEFINEGGTWKLWRFRECGGGFDLDVDIKYDTRKPQPWRPMGAMLGKGPQGPMPEDRNMPPMPQPDPEYKDPAELVSRGDWYMGYGPMTPTIYYPALAEPYESWDPKDSYFEFKYGDNLPVE